MLPKPGLHAIAGEQRYWKRFFTRYTRFLYKDLKLLDSYVASNFKLIRSVFNYLANQKGLPVGQFHRQFKIPCIPVEPVVLLPEQLSFLISNAGFRCQLPARLHRALDICIIGCSTGLRIGDLLKLEPKHLQTQEGQASLEVHTEKTGAKVYIPLPGYCLQILDKYRLHRSKWLLPRIQLFILNRQLKEIGRLAGWDWVLPKMRSRQGCLTEIKNKQGQSFRFYEHLSAHTMRRTAITTLLMMGVEEQVVRRISGHSPGSKEFYKYVALSQSYMNRQVSDAFENLVKHPGMYREKKP